MQQHQLCQVFLAVSSMDAEQLRLQGQQWPPAALLQGWWAPLGWSPHIQQPPSPPAMGYSQGMPLAVACSTWPQQQGTCSRRGGRLALCMRAESALAAKVSHQQRLQPPPPLLFTRQFPSPGSSMVWKWNTSPASLSEAAAASPRFVTPPCWPPPPSLPAVPPGVLQRRGGHDGGRHQEGVQRGHLQRQPPLLPGEVGAGGGSKGGMGHTPALLVRQEHQRWAAPPAVEQCNQLDVIPHDSCAVRAAWQLADAVCAAATCCTLHAGIPD